jgi:hypothetical protein
MDQSEKTVVAKAGGRYSPRPHPFFLQASGQIIKDDVNGFTSTSDMCFVYVSSCRLQFPVPLFLPLCWRPEKLQLWPLNHPALKVAKTVHS